MSVTGQNVVDRCRDIMNAAGSTQWTDSTELTPWCGMAMWQLWANLLNANRHLKMQQVTVTQDSNGQFTVASLTTGTTDAKKYFYRILSLALPSGANIQFFYRQTQYEQFPNPQPNTSLPYVWYRFGDYIQVLPIASGQTMTATVNYRPPSIIQLSALSVAVDFPEGYEYLISWRGAQLALLKGGSESQAAKDIKQKADDMESQMLQDLGRESRWPVTALSFDDPSEWAG